MIRDNGSEAPGTLGAGAAGDQRTLAQLRSDVAQTLLLHGRLDLPDLPQPAATHQEVTKLLSAQVLASKLVTATPTTPAAASAAAQPPQQLNLPPAGPAPAPAVRTTPPRAAAQ